MEPPSGIDPARTGRSPTEAASELAEGYFGALSRRLLREQGHPPSRIDHWLATGRLFPLYPGVYAWGRPDLPEKGELAAGLLYAGPGSALGGLSALWWRSLLEDRPRLIHIDAPGHASSRQDLLIRHPRRMGRSLHRDLPVARLDAALLTATADLSHNALRNVLARAEFEGMLSLSSLQTAIAHGPPGSRALRAAISAHLPQLARCRNPFECDFVLLCERFGLEIPEPNARKGRYVPDMTWERCRLIVELDGKRAHRTAAQKRRDAERQRWLEARGYTVIRFSWAQVQYEPQAVAAKLRPYLLA